jgi:hypothetical protein
VEAGDYQGEASVMADNKSEREQQYNFSRSEQ